MLDARFISGTASLYSPLSGTEHLAPLLYSLIRSVRPRSVVEFGMGYTTPFIVKALSDNQQDVDRERPLLIAKTREAHQVANTVESQRDWFLAQPTGADPRFYEPEYQPMLYAFDDFSEEYSSAPKVMEALTALGLERFMTLSKSSAINHSSIIAPSHLPIDLAWNDALDYEAFFDEYWPLVNPNGGLMIFHNTVNGCPKCAMFVKQLKLKQVSQFSDFELLSFFEPYKLHQNSYTVIRKITAFKEHFLDWDQKSIAESALRLIDKH
ncbi:class I SAM-dependent methyltransferase [Methylomonas sp. MED-D]|uniref:class I SAM-dependent methyltransferase n=1 Tax=unclassified Methylomonas TaxID=2608980 RepID=UPI000A7BB3B0|nr:MULTISPECIES: class I SAM-dependent methyltransferase [unclassified Methylomonas]MDT4332323.1 class I SAM-dependent methyltransferase [Methylomonas sp. MV1]